MGEIENSGITLTKEGIDFLYFQKMLWSQKRWLSIGLIVGFLFGLFYLLITPKIYYSEAVLSLKSSKNDGFTSSQLMQLGGIGGAVASQLGMGNVNASKFEILAKGRLVPEDVIREHDLLPLLYPDYWNASLRKWKDNIKPPSILSGIGKLRQMVKYTNKDGVIYFGINGPEPELTQQIVVYYLSALNKRIQDGVKREANLNRQYLEQQADSTQDPLLREKIQHMIASEIEKSMLVSTESFELLEPPIVSYGPVQPIPKLVLFLSVFCGFLFSIIVIVAVHFIGLWRCDISRRSL